MTVKDVSQLQWIWLSDSNITSFVKKKIEWRKMLTFASQNKHIKWEIKNISCFLLIYKVVKR